MLLDPVVPLMFDICEESRWGSLLQASGNSKPTGASTDDEDIVEYSTVCLGRRHGRFGSTFSPSQRVEFINVFVLSSLQKAPSEMNVYIEASTYRFGLGMASKVLI